jgi:hypothetical protein
MYIHTYIHAYIKQALEGSEDDGQGVTELERMLFIDKDKDVSERDKDKQIEELKRQLELLRTNSVPMSDYKRAIQVCMYMDICVCMYVYVCVC